MADQPTNDAPATPPAPPRFSWRTTLALWLAMMLTCAGSHLLVGWYNRRGARPLMVIGTLLYISSMMAVGAHRRWKAAKEGRPPDRRWRLSMAELLMLFTGLVVYIGFNAAEHHRVQRVHRARQQFTALATPLLGEDGRITFEADGDVSIMVVDRSFDDDQLAEVASLISRNMPGAGVHMLGFGSSPKTAATPPRWPGVTDRSAALILRWNELEFLFLDGTAISAKQKKRLATLLPALHPTCQETLEQSK